jgi:hypothetical protein
MADHSITYYDEHTLMLVTPAGFLRMLHTPFQVRSVEKAGLVKPNTLVFVDAVKADDASLILYRVLNDWFPYNYFKLIIK